MRNLSQDFQADGAWQAVPFSIPAVITSCSFTGSFALAVGAQGHKVRGSELGAVCLSK